MFIDLQRDIVILMASRGVRAFAFSYLSVIFAIYLNQLGYATVTIGLVFTTAYASGAVLTALWGFLSDRYGRRRILMLLAGLTILANLIYLFFSHLIFILLSVIIANVGASSAPEGKEAAHLIL
jgi:MFS family permease